MTKQANIEKKAINQLIKRNKQALKESKVNTSVLIINETEKLDEKLLSCKKQNSLIDLAVANKKSFADIVTLLTLTKLCKSSEHATMRLKRHISNDIKSAIAKRAIALMQ